MRTHQQRFKRKLASQLGYLERSCKSYDEGYTDEAIRMAVVMRVVLHDTKGKRGSRSLLKHLDAKDIMLLSTCRPDDVTPNTALYFGLGMHKATTDPDKSEYIPGLDKSFYAQEMPAPQWWEQIVHVLNRETRITRKDITLAAANKDGGAHVDERLTPEYEKLASPGSVGAFAVNRKGKQERRLIEDAHLVCLRQMGYELLNSPDLRQLATTYAT